MIDKAQTLDQLRQCIPSIDCNEGCTACCGHVPWSEFEFEQLTEDEQARFRSFTLKCPFAYAGRCNVYDKRPVTCRIFAVTKGLDCPRGATPSKVLDTHEIVPIMKKYDEIFFRGDAK